jgi:2-keto-4-pentenoate hydratase
MLNKDQFVLGAPAPADWRSFDLVEQKPVMTLRGRQFIGHGKNVLGDPLIALTWLANELRQLGLTLRAGEVVTTGACHAPLPIQAGDRFEVDFGSIGRLSVSFA